MRPTKFRLRKFRISANIGTDGVEPSESTNTNALAVFVDARRGFAILAVTGLVIAMVALSGCASSDTSRTATLTGTAQPAWESSFIASLETFYPDADMEPQRYIGFGYGYCAHIRLFPQDQDLARAIQWERSGVLWDYELGAAEGIARSAAAHLCPNGIKHPREDYGY